MMNEIFFYQATTRHIDLLRYEKTVRAQVFEVMDEIQQAVDAQAFSGSLKADWQIRKVQDAVGGGFERIEPILAAQPVLEAQTQWLYAVAAGAVLAYGLSDAVHPVERQSIAESAKRFTVGGLTLSEALAKQRDDLRFKLKSLLRSAMIDERLPEREEIDALFARARQTAQTMTRTWINAVMHTASDAFAAINPVIKGFRHVSVLDGSTSALCTRRNGLLWDKKHRPIGHREIFRRPPLHYNCRSMLIYVYDLKEPFNGFSGDDWVKSRSLNQLQQQFGRGIGQMLFEGKVRLSDTLEQLQPLTFKQLQERLPAEPVDTRFAANTI